MNVVPQVLYNVVVLKTQLPNGFHYPFVGGEECLGYSGYFQGVQGY